MRKRIKITLARKFRYYPLLKLLVLKPGFRIAFLLAFFLVVGSFLALPKMWRVSPRGFEPVIYVSGVDLVQCWSLKRSARNLAAAGNYANAQAAWYQASGQNPSDLSTMRGFLDNYLHVPRPEPRMKNASLAQIGWLTRLGQTNAADVTRAARLLDKERWYDVAYHYLNPLKDKLSPEAEEVFLKALFQNGRVQEFAQRLKRLDPNSMSPALALYRRAYLMGWGTDAESAEAERALRSEMNTPENGSTAARAYMFASAARNNPAGYDQALRRLTSVNEAGVFDHANYWSLLASQGRKEEARQLADAFTSAPKTGTELVKLADTYFHLGQTNACLDVLRKFVPAFSQDAEVWLYYANFLQETKNWPDLRLIALAIREQTTLFGKLWGFSYYLEGLSDYREKIFDGASGAFAKAAELHYELPGLAFRVAREIAALNYGRESLGLLAQIEGDERFASNPDFWETYFAAAYSAKDSLAVMKAAEHSYRLKPEDAQVHNRYAAALILNQRDPQESIKLTLELLNRYPQSIAAAINHAFALLLNRRVEEARVLLEGLSVRTMDPQETIAWHLGLFEVYVNTQNWSKAREHASHVRKELLFPVQRERFDKLREKLPEQVASQA